MRTFVVSYLNHEMLVGPAEAGGPPPCGWTAMDDGDWAACFEALMERERVWVCCWQGLRRLAEYLRCRFAMVKAAGGLVSAPDGQRLLIFREGHWDLPKGMVEPGETLRQAALREVREETGLGSLKMGPLLLKTYHIYDKYGGWHLKQTSWFAMDSPAALPATPQAEEGISRAVWVSSDCCRQRLHDSFATLRRLADCVETNH